MQQYKMLLPVLVKYKKIFPECNFHVHFDAKIKRYCIIFTDLEVYLSSKNKVMSKILHTKYNKYVSYYACFLSIEGITKIKDEGLLLLSK